MKISEAKGKIKIGDWVRTNGGVDVTRSFFEGEIGEIYYDRFYVWQNEIDGSRGSISPFTRGYKYSCVIFWSSPGEIEILKSETTMQKLTSTLKRVLSPELQKLYKAGLIDGNLELTDEGQNEIWALLLKQFEAELVKVAEEKLAEEEKK